MANAYIQVAPDSTGKKMQTFENNVSGNDVHSEAVTLANTAGQAIAPFGAFLIPAFDYQEFTYYGATNNIQTQVFKSGGSGGTTVATLTFVYVGGGASDDDLIQSITQS